MRALKKKIRTKPKRSIALESGLTRASPQRRRCIRKPVAVYPAVFRQHDAAQSYNF